MERIVSEQGSRVSRGRTTRHVAVATRRDTTWAHIRGHATGSHTTSGVRVHGPLLHVGVSHRSSHVVVHGLLTVGRAHGSLLLLHVRVSYRSAHVGVADGAGSHVLVRANVGSCTVLSLVHVVGAWLAYLVSCCLLLCIRIFSEEFRELAVVNRGCGRDIRIALKHLKRIFQAFDDLSQSSTSLRNVLRLTQRIEDGLVLVDLLVKFGLELVLGHADHEVTNQLGDRLTNSADSDLEDSVDTGADFLDENVGSTSASGLLLLLLLWLLGDDLAILVVLRRHLVFLRNDRGAVLFVLLVVDEHVVLFGVNDGLNEITSVVAFSLKNEADDVHDFWTEGRASHENALDNAGSESLELGVTVLDKFKGRVAEFIKLRCDQVLKHID